MYDVIVIGARVAGSPTAMLLARKGFRVLLVDRASFPSDTLSTHLIQLKGAAALKRWGLLEKVMASNCPPIPGMAFQMDRFHLHGKYFPLGGLETTLCPRRTALDKILVEAAVEGGAELRQDLIVEELLADSGRITGIRGRIKAKGDGIETRVTENSKLVIGADGKHSLVAKTVQPEEYENQSAQSCAYYTYWEGMHLEVGELYMLENGAVGLFPTNDGETVVFTGYPVAEFNTIREDVEGYFWKTMRTIPGLTERLRNGHQAGRFYGTTDLPSFYRHPYGSGWALVGDAGLTMDPVTGQGIGNAFCDAERLAQAVEAGFSGHAPLEKAMSIYEKERNAETLPMFKFTGQTASYGPNSLQQELLFEALEKKPAEVERFFGVITGSVQFKEFFSPANLFRIMGIRGMSKIILAGRRRSLAGKTVTTNLEAG